jgi:hypothetical protein
LDVLFERSSSFSESVELFELLADVSVTVVAATEELVESLLVGEQRAVAVVEGDMTTVVLLVGDVVEGSAVVLATEDDGLLGIEFEEVDFIVYCCCCW